MHSTVVLCTKGCGFKSPFHCEKEIIKEERIRKDEILIENKGVRQQEVVVKQKRKKISVQDTQPKIDYKRERENTNKRVPYIPLGTFSVPYSI